MVQGEERLEKHDAKGFIIKYCFKKILFISFYQTLENDVVSAKKSQDPEIFELKISGS